VFVELDAGGACVHLQTSVYHLDDVAVAAHKLTGRAFVHISGSDARITCRMRPKSTMENLEHLAGDFVNEVLDQRLRRQLATQTEPVRALIIAQAFSRTNLLHPELDALEETSDG
jgi:His-Xaa-Ser system protein HxsD